MLRAALAVLLVTLSLGAPVSAAPSAEQQAMLGKDVAGGADHPLVGRYQGSILVAQTVKAFDELTLPNGPAEGPTYSDAKKFTSTLTVQGKVTRSIYVAPAGRSALEVLSNVEDFVAQKGFEVVFRCQREACGESFALLKYHWDRLQTKVIGQGYDNNRRLLIDAAFDTLADVRYTLFKRSTPEGDSYVAIFGGLHRGGSFGDFSALLSDRVGVLVETVEPRPMDRRMEVVSAAQIGGRLATEGRAVFYGIQFDFDKAEIKPESEPQLAEMAKFLKETPGASAFVVGHTDGQGTLDYNLALSSKRADAVVQALVRRYGIAAGRLVPRGLGPLAPLASNRTEEGRAKNRRVELVERGS